MSKTTIAVEVITGSLKTLVVASLIGITINGLAGLGATKLGILGIGYLTIAILGTIVSIKRKLAFLKLVQQLSAKTMDLDGLKDYLKDKKKDKE